MPNASRPSTVPPRRRSSSPGLPGREFVQGLERGFAVIKAFGSGAPALTITDVAMRTGLTRAVARRYLLTLEALGCVVHRGPQFSLTPRILDLGFTFLSTLNVAGVAPPFMEALVEVLHDSCSVGVLDGADVVYVARVPARRIMSINLVVGSRLPAHATSLGKVLLSSLAPAALDAYLASRPLQRMTKRTIVGEEVFRRELQEVRKRGWALSDEEFELGVRTVAAPLLDHTGQVQAAINVSGHAGRVSMAQLRRDYLPPLLDAAQQISWALGARTCAASSRDRSPATTGARGASKPARLRRR
jgi:IclR family transcriptional regulator, pca regulon regulatory protein